MWLRFSFTACSASGTKLAPITGTRSALQYCCTLACSKAWLAGFIAPPRLPPPPAASHTHSSPAGDARTVPVPDGVRSPRVWDAPTRQSSADGAPPPHPCSPAPRLVRSPSSADPSPAACPSSTTRSWPACPPLDPGVAPDSAIAGRSSPASDRARAIAATAAIPPVPPASAPAPPGNAPDPTPASSGRSGARAAPRTAARARSPRRPAAVVLGSAWPASAASSTSWCAPLRNPYHPPWESWSRPTRILRPPAATGVRARCPWLRPPAEACRRSAVVRPAGSRAADTRSTRPVLHPRQGHQVVAPEVAYFAFHPTLFVASARIAEIAFEAPVGTKRNQPTGLFPLIAAQDLLHCALQVVVAQSAEDTAKIAKRQLMRLQEGLLRGVIVGHMKGPAAGHRAHGEDVNWLALARHLDLRVVPIHLRLAAPFVHLRHKGLPRHLEI